MPHATSLQVGAFGELRNAEALRARLARLYPDVVVVPIDRDGVRLHCVRLGGLASEREVTARLAALRAAGYSPIRVRD
jgi:cell division protein FtsN